jgi:hypothetical protein
MDIINTTVSWRDGGRLAKAVFKQTPSEQRQQVDGCEERLTNGWVWQFNGLLGRQTIPTVSSHPGSDPMLQTLGCGTTLGY